MKAKKFRFGGIPLPTKRQGEDTPGVSPRELHPKIRLEKELSPWEQPHAGCLSRAQRILMLVSALVSHLNSKNKFTDFQSSLVGKHILMQPETTTVSTLSGMPC